jgi:hypothetical protein
LNLTDKANRIPKIELEGIPEILTKENMTTTDLVQPQISAEPELLVTPVAKKKAPLSKRSNAKLLEDTEVQEVMK